jgi:alpha-glucosidase
MIRILLLAAITLLYPLQSLGNTNSLSLSSPDGQLQMQFNLATMEGSENCPVYSLSWKGQTLIGPSRLGLVLDDTPPMTENLALSRVTTTNANTIWEPVAGERSSIPDHYNAVEIELNHQSKTTRRIIIRFRAYNEGLAFQLQIPPQVGLAQANVSREISEFRLTDNHRTWATYSAQGEYEETRISHLKPQCERPLLIDTGNNAYLAIAEAGLTNYARTKLSPLPDIPNGLITQNNGPSKGPLPLNTPWRVILVGHSPGQLLEQNYLLPNLNPPSQIQDTSWIRPGKVIREVTLTTTGALACINFAHKNGLQFVEFDAGWYGHEYEDLADATTVSVDPKRSPGPLDLPAVIQHARDHNIGVLLYVNRRALEYQLDSILPLYRSWGVSGVKYGFVNVGSQDWTRWLHEAIRKAADHQLMVDVHDEYRGTGVSRTYPNLMTMEGIRGDEASPSARQTLITCFTRMLAGRADNTVCYRNPRVDELWSHSFQLAKPVCLFSPWQFLFWYDRPDQLQDLPELEFFKDLPTSWDETRVLHGDVGRYAVIARRHGNEWFIGALNADEPQTLPLSYRFLPQKTYYHATRWIHDPHSPNPTRLKKETSLVSASSVHLLKLPANNGMAIHLTPTTMSSDH